MKKPIAHTPTSSVSVYLSLFSFRDSSVSIEKLVYLTRREMVQSVLDASRYRGLLVSNRGGMGSVGCPGLCAAIFFDTLEHSISNDAFITIPFCSQDRPKPAGLWDLSAAKLIFEFFPVSPPSLDYVIISIRSTCKLNHMTVVHTCTCMLLNSDTAATS